MTRPASASLVLASLLIAACGGSSPGSSSDTSPPPAGQTVAVTTAPGDAEIEPGASVKFGAQVTGTADGSVVWSVAEADGGTIDATGLYTAPSAEGTFHVKAASTTSSKSNGTSVVRVKKGAVAQVLVAVDPATITVPAGGTRSFAAVVTGTATRTVTWTVQEGSGCGSVTPAGLYTAPNAGATCRVVATSVADTTRSGTATITVTAPAAPVVAVALSPTTVTLDACKGQAFKATVTNTANTAVTWTVVEAGGGTVTNGAYLAPTAAGTYHVVASSQADPSKTAQATVTVGPERVLAVEVVPGSGTVQASGQLAFAANVVTTCGTFAAR